MQVCDRIHTNATKIEKMLETFSVEFQSSNAVVNLVSKAVLPSTSANQLLDHKNIGLSCIKILFPKELMVQSQYGLQSKLCNLKTFKTQVKTVKSNVGNQLS